MPHHLLACPGCRLTDQVQQVSAVVKAGSATTYSLGHTTGRIHGVSWLDDRSGVIGGSFSATTEVLGEQSSTLSQGLAPPAKPYLATGWGLVSVALLLLSLMAGWLALTTVPGLHCAHEQPNGPVRTACWSGRGALFLEMREGKLLTPTTLTQVVDGALVALPVGLLASMLALRLIVGNRRWRRFRHDYQQWKREYDRWQRLYYCYRCDGVFEPSGRTADVRTTDVPERHSFAEI